MGWTVRSGRPPLLLPSCRKLEFRLSALMDSDLAWVNGKSGRQSWRYADAFQRAIISEAIYHLFNQVCHRMLYPYGNSGCQRVKMWISNWSWICTECLHIIRISTATANISVFFKLCTGQKRDHAKLFVSICLIYLLCSVWFVSLKYVNFRYTPFMIKIMTTY